MIGINNIGIHIPSHRIDNLGKTTKHRVTESFIRDKIGIVQLARKKEDQRCSDLCHAAYEDLAKCAPDIHSDQFDFLCVCTQNGDHQLPQTASIVQSKLDLPLTCAAFDISLGCSGYVYSLHIAKSFMEANELKHGLVFTSDPYSQIVDPEDKNTDLLFGDAATVTYLSHDARLSIEKASFLSEGKKYTYLIKRKDQKLYMNGRGIFEFTMLHIPPMIESCLKINSLNKQDVDLYLFHQASKYIIDNLCRRMDIDAGRVPFAMADYGNTVSSSIPIMLKDHLDDSSKSTFLLCGFGVGLSLAATVLRRIR